MLGRSIDHHTAIGNWACLGHCLETVASYLRATGRADDASRIVGATEAMRLTLSTVEATYEKYNLDLYPWIDAIDEHPDLAAARDEGRQWDRHELVARAQEYVGSGTPAA